MAELIIKTKKFGDVKVLLDDVDMELAVQMKLYVSYMPKTKSYYVINSFKKYLHRIIMNAQAGQVVDHINHNTLDNRRCNLRLVTHSQNRLHSKKAYDDNQKLSELQVQEIIKSGASSAMLAKKYGVSNCLISKIKNGMMYSNYCPGLKRQDKKEHICKNVRPALEMRVIKTAVLSGARIKDISDKWNISTPELYKIKNDKKWRKVKLL